MKPSHGGSDHFTRGKPAVYKEVMKDTSYAVIERIEFDLPWQWPPASVQPFMEDGKLEDGAIAHRNPDSRGEGMEASLDGKRRQETG